MADLDRDVRRTVKGATRELKQAQRARRRLTKTIQSASAAMAR